MDDGFGNGFIVGIVVSILFIDLAVGIISSAPLEGCEKAHNVYKCEWIAVPVEESE